MNLGGGMSENEVADEIATMLMLPEPERKSVILMARRIAQAKQLRDEKLRVDLQGSDPS